MMNLSMHAWVDQW